MWHLQSARLTGRRSAQATACLKKAVSIIFRDDGPKDSCLNNMRWSSTQVRHTTGAPCLCWKQQLHQPPARPPWPHRLQHQITVAPNISRFWHAVAPAILRAPSLLPVRRHVKCCPSCQSHSCHSDNASRSYCLSGNYLQLVVLYVPPHAWLPPPQKAASPPRSSPSTNQTQPERDVQHWRANPGPGTRL